MSNKQFILHAIRASIIISGKEWVEDTKHMLKPGGGLAFAKGNPCLEAVRDHSCLVT
jgi:hypothetical protein